MSIIFISHLLLLSIWIICIATYYDSNHWLTHLINLFEIIYTASVGYGEFFKALLWWLVSFISLWYSINEYILELIFLNSTIYMYDLYRKISMEQNDFEYVARNVFNNISLRVNIVSYICTCKCFYRSKWI